MALPTTRAELDPLLAKQWLPPDLGSRADDAWRQRLAIVVPYRDREAHLQLFVPYLQEYFRHDKLDRQIPYTIHVVEQADDRPFNRGQLANAAFRLIGDTADYLCIHDVDLMPLWADYAFPAHPARLALHGSPNRQDVPLYFGGVTAISMADFERVNGFSNGYWGWGYEDHDLRLRTLAAGMRVEARDGRYNALRHAHNGFMPDGRLSAAGQRNHERFECEWAAGFEHWRSDGLNSQRFEHLGTTPLQLGAHAWSAVRHHRVRLRD
jgi:hypothetical protein